MGASGAHAGRAVSGLQAGARSTRVLFVCLGNICRSPTAEGVMRALVSEAGLEDRDRARLRRHGRLARRQPAGPARARRGRARRGVALAGHARQVRAEDFEDFDLLLAMDRANLRELRQTGARRAGAREGAAAARVRPGERGRRGPRRARSLLRRARAASTRCSSSCSAACAGLLEQIARDLTGEAAQ